LIVFHPYRSLRSFLSQYQVRAVFQDVHHAECARGPHDSYDCQRVACVSMLAVYHRGWITLLGWRKCRNGPRQTTSVRKQWTWEHCIEGRHAKYLQRLLPIFRCSTRLHRQVQLSYRFAYLSHQFYDFMELHVWILQIALGALSLVSDEVLDPKRNLSPTWGTTQADVQRYD
jgi:hypothetical protein